MPKRIKKPQFINALHLEKKQIWRIFQALKSGILAKVGGIIWIRMSSEHVSRLCTQG